MKCQSCHRDVLASARQCPHCGRATTSAAADGAAAAAEEAATRAYGQAAPVLQPADDTTQATVLAPLTSTTGPQILVGRRGQYLIGKKLAKGGMGQLFLVQEMDASPPRDLVAKKSIKKDGLERGRFVREIEIAARIGDPTAGNLVAIVDWGEDQNGPFLVMPRYRLGSLHDYVAERGPFEESELQRLARGLAHAIAFVHGKGILHRDIKPPNVLLAENLEPHLCDFGIARDMVATTNATGQACGSKGYSAPEQLAGDVTDFRADLFSFGATIWYAATGKHPTALNEAQVPPSLRAIVMRCLQPRPELRYASAVELLDAVKQGGRARVEATPTPNSDACPACGAVNAQSAHHCTACGKSLSTNCPRCKRRNRGTLRFCWGCGFSIEGYLQGEELLQRAEQAMATGNLDETQRLLDAAAKAYPEGIDRTSALRQEFVALRREIDTARRQARRLRNGGEAQAALEAYVALQRLLPSDQEAGEEIKALSAEVRRLRVDGLAADIEAAAANLDYRTAVELTVELEKVARDRNDVVARCRAAVATCRAERLEALRAELPPRLPRLSPNEFEAVLAELIELGMTEGEARALRHRFGDHGRSRRRRVVMAVLTGAVATAFAWLLWLSPWLARRGVTSDLLLAMEDGRLARIGELLVEPDLDDGLRADATAVQTLLAVDWQARDARLLPHLGTLDLCRQRGWRRHVDAIAAAVRQRVLADCGGTAAGDRGSAPLLSPVLAGCAVTTAGKGDGVIRTCDGDGRLPDLPECAWDTSVQIGDGPLVQFPLRIVVDRTPPTIQEHPPRDGERAFAVDDGAGEPVTVVIDPPVPGARFDGLATPLRKAKLEVTLPVGALRPDTDYTLRATDAVGNTTRHPFRHTQSAPVWHARVAETEGRFVGNCFEVELAFTDLPTDADPKLEWRSGSATDTVACTRQPDGSWRSTLPAEASTQVIELGVAIGTQRRSLRTFDLRPLGLDTAADVPPTAEPQAELGITWQRPPQQLAWRVDDGPWQALPIAPGTQACAATVTGLHEGGNLVTVRATDAFGREELRTSTLVRDSRAAAFVGNPTLILAPGGSQTLAVDRRLLGARLVGEAKGLRVRADGASVHVSVDADAPWSAERAFDVELRTHTDVTEPARLAVTVAPTLQVVVDANPGMAQDVPYPACSFARGGDQPVVLWAKAQKLLATSGPRLQLPSSNRLGTPRRMGTIPGSPLAAVTFDSGRVAVVRVDATAQRPAMLWDAQPGVPDVPGARHPEGLVGAVALDERTLVTLATNGTLTRIDRDEPDCGLRLPLAPTEPANAAAAPTFDSLAALGRRLFVGCRDGFHEVAITADGTFAPGRFHTQDGWRASRVVRLLCPDGDAPGVALLRSEKSVPGVSAPTAVWSLRAGVWSRLDQTNRPDVKFVAASPRYVALAEESRMLTLLARDRPATDPLVRQQTRLDGAVLDLWFDGPHTLQIAFASGVVKALHLP
jgi:hypothetical protein